jgi:tyrosyl-tRNA synthetase
MSTSLSLDEQVAHLTRGALAVIEPAELRAKLARAVPLIVKLGADPTAPDLHLGHSVVLHALRRYQELGHRVQFLIGDFTGAIGDPSGRNRTRPQLAAEDIRAAAATYAEQVARILDPACTEIVFNSTWYATMSVAEFVRLASHWTVARMLERDDFARRYAKHEAIAIHELLYPLAQGYDSVAMRADVELGGGDQRFNLLVGRGLQRDYGQEPQVVMMLPLLLGTDGVDKMSKSHDNAIGIAEPPAIQVTKTMQIADETMWQWYGLISERSPAEVAQLHDDPRAAKLALAREVATRYHGHAAAAAAVEEYERKARGGEPDAMPELALTTPGLVDALVATKLAKNRIAARENITNNAVTVDGQRVTDITATLTPGAHVLRHGKSRFARVIVRGNPL